MQLFPAAFPAWLAAALAAWLVIGAGVYLGLARSAAMGGKVSVKEFDFRDLFVLSVFVVWFGAAIPHGFTSKANEVSVAVLLEGGALYLGIVAILGMFLRLRGIRLWQQFGLGKRNPFLCLAMAFGLLLAAYPLVGGAGLLMQGWLHGKAQEQPLVQFFREAAKNADHTGVLVTILAGVLVAPVAEETIFRGYIYGVLKRYCGGLPAALLASALFAAMHVNGASLGPLFVLALCLTLAYEVTGSLLVNICMHAMFNLFTFLGLLWAVRHLPKP